MNRSPEASAWWACLPVVQLWRGAHTFSSRWKNVKWCCCVSCGEAPRGFAVPGQGVTQTTLSPRSAQRALVSARFWAGPRMLGSCRSREDAGQVSARRWNRAETEARHPDRGEAVRLREAEEVAARRPLAGLQAPPRVPGRCAAAATGKFCCRPATGPAGGASAVGRGCCRRESRSLRPRAAPGR